MGALSKRLSVRLVFQHPPSASQLSGLRSLFSDLAKIPPVDLHEHLTSSPVCVVGSVPCSESGGLAKSVEARWLEVAALGLEVEFFDLDDYGAPYVRSLLLAAPSSWSEAEQTLELQFRPSFSPEVILRFWNYGGEARLLLVSLGIRVWARRLCVPPWLASRSRRLAIVDPSVGADRECEEPPVPPEQPQDETAEVATIDDLLPLAIELPEPRRVVGTDGMAVEIVARSGANHVSRELWSPTQSREPEAHELVRRALALAQGSLCEAASHRRHEELETRLVLAR